MSPAQLTTLLRKIDMGHNITHLAELQGASGLSRLSFLSVLQNARRDRLISLSMVEAMVTERDRTYGIVEAGSLLVWASVRSQS